MPWVQFPYCKTKTYLGDCYLEERGRGLSVLWIPDSHPDLLISTLDIHVSPFQFEDVHSHTLGIVGIIQLPILRDELGSARSLSS